MVTFDDMQCSFALFKAPIAQAETDSLGECRCCNKMADIRFESSCYSCFRRGLSNKSMDTELGLIFQDLALLGRTHGLPLNPPYILDDYELTPHPIDPNFPDHEWFYVHISPTWLLELLRTPSYRTWQGERWLFCCKRPMVFRGSFPSTMFSNELSQIENNIRRFLESPRWERALANGHSSHTYYAFTCDTCERLRFHEDCD